MLLEIILYFMLLLLVDICVIYILMVGCKEDSLRIKVGK